MTWVKPPSTAAVHHCKRPESESLSGFPVGVIWRCDECRTLWTVSDGCWLKAGPLLRFRHRRDGYPPKPPYDVVNADGSTTHYSSEAEQNAGWAGVYTLPIPVAGPPGPPADFDD